MNTISPRTGILVVMFLVGCQAGPMIHELDEPKRPFGANVRIEVLQSDTARRQEYEGELIEAREDGLVIAITTEENSTSRITFAPWVRIVSMRATNLPGFRARGKKTPSSNSGSSEKVRIISRFPQGLSPELLEQLLVSFEQTTVDSLP